MDLGLHYIELLLDPGEGEFIHLTTAEVGKGFQCREGSQNEFLRVENSLVEGDLQEAFNREAGHQLEKHDTDVMRTTNRSRRPYSQESWESKGKPCEQRRCWFYLTLIMHTVFWKVKH